MRFPRFDRSVPPRMAAASGVHGNKTTQFRKNISAGSIIYLGQLLSAVSAIKAAHPAGSDASYTNVLSGAPSTA